MRRWPSRERDTKAADKFHARQSCANPPLCSLVDLLAHTHTMSLPGRTLEPAAASASEEEVGPRSAATKVSLTGARDVLHELDRLIESGSSRQACRMSCQSVSFIAHPVVTFNLLVTRSLTARQLRQLATYNSLLIRARLTAKQLISSVCLIREHT